MRMWSAQMPGKRGEMIQRKRRSLETPLEKIALAILIAALPAFAQQPQPDQQSPAATPPAQEQAASDDQAKSNDKAKSGDQSNPDTKDNSNQNPQETLHNGTSNDRLFYTLPNFLTVQYVGHLPPLTTGQKFKVVVRSSFDYVEYPWYAALAGISQAQNSEAGYGQGAEGYAKRYGAAFADGTIENFMTSAILPSILKQDPRYYQLGSGGFWHRTGYAIKRIFVTYSDSGREEFNYSEIFGSALAAGISTYSYHPHDERNLGNTASVWGTQVGYDALSYTVKEFWPDIRRKLSKAKRRADPTP
jgi:hypothetical protein